MMKPVHPPDPLTNHLAGSGSALGEAQQSQLCPRAVFWGLSKSLTLLSHLLCLLTGLLLLDNLT